MNNNIESILQKISIAIVDDEDIFLEHFAEIVEDHFRASKKEFEISKFKSSKELYVCGKSFDLYFLDIEMPEVSGTEIAESIRESYGRIPEVIFVTSNNHAVYDVFEFEALGFIRKTYLENDFEKSMRIFWNKKKSLDNMFELKCDGATILKKSEEIIYVEVFAHRVVFHCLDGDYGIWGSLDNVEQLLNESGFVKTHRCYLVNMKYIDKLETKSVILQLLEGVEIPIGKQYTVELKRKYVHYLMGDR